MAAKTPKATARRKIKVDQAEAPKLSYSGLMSQLTDSVNGSVTLGDGSKPLVHLEGASRWDPSQVIRSGNLALDMLLGVGGFPVGRITELFGDQGCGKTTHCLMAVASAQAAGIPVVYIDAENALDGEYMKSLGVDLELLSVAQTNIVQDAINLIVSVCNDLQRLMPEDAPIRGLIVVDSIGALADRAIIDADSADAKGSIASGARVWSAQLPKVADVIRKTRVALININQLRGAFGGFSGPGGASQGPKNTTMGGKALGYFSSVRIALKKKEMMEKTGWNGSYELNRSMITTKIVKNKVASPGREQTSALYPNRGYDDEEVLIETAFRYGVFLYDVKGSPTPDGKVRLEKSNSSCTYIFSPEEVEEYNRFLDDNALDGDRLSLGDFVSVRFKSKFEPIIRGEYYMLYPLIERRILNTLNTGGRDCSVDDLIADGDEEGTEEMTSATNPKLAKAEAEPVELERAGEMRGELEDVSGKAGGLSK